MISLIRKKSLAALMIGGRMSLRLLREISREMTLKLGTGLAPWDDSASSMTNHSVDPNFGRIDHIQIHTRHSKVSTKSHPTLNH